VLVVKRGEHGALLFLDDSIFAAPAFLLETVLDPTGAGDSFAGGMMGVLSKVDARDPATLRQAVVMGGVLASFAVEAEAARTQATNPSSPSDGGTTPPPVAAEPPPAAAADPDAQGAAPATGLTQEGAGVEAAAPEPQLAQAQPPAPTAPVSITKPAAAEPAGTSLGAFLARNWALTLIIALVVVGLGLVFAARRATSATPEPAERAGDDGAAAETRASGAKETSAAALREASAAAQASTPKATKLKAATPEAATPKATTPEALTAGATAASTPEAAETPAADARPLAGAAALAGGAAVSKSRKKARKEVRQEARRKKKGARADSPAVEETLATAPAAQEPFVEEPSAEVVGGSAVEEPSAVAHGEAAVEESLVEAAREPAVEETFVETPSVEEVHAEESAAAPPEVEEPEAEVAAVEEAGVAFAAFSPAGQVEEAELPLPAAEAHALVESPAEEVAEVSAAPEVEGADTSFVESPEVASAETDFDTTDEAASAGTEFTPTAPGIAPDVAEAFAHKAAEPEAAEAVEPKAVEPEAVAAEAPAASTEIEPAFAPEPEQVQAETRRLLEGEAYDRAVIGTRDPVARQMIAAELLSALAGRNPQRRERAGAAFVEEGYYDETASDLREADAPAERAAAARSLALLGDRSATPLLVEALEDASLDVRRAAVEALGALRDPAAVAPLEALLERERSERHRVPPRVIRVAADSCRDAAAELDAELALAEQPPAEVGRADADAPVELEPAAESPSHTAEPFRESDAGEFPTQTYAPAAESGQATLFDEGAAEESTRELAPYQSGASGESDAAGEGGKEGEWFDFDMHELRAEPQAAGPEPAAPSYRHEEVYEFSSGETFTSHAEAGASESYAAEEEPPASAEAGGETSREVEVYDAGEYEPEEAAPAAAGERGIAPFNEHSTVPASIQQRLASRNPSERAAAIVELSHVDTDEAFQQICAGFDDPSKDVRNAAARALHELRADRAESFTRALREATPERRRGIGMALSSSGLAAESISQLTGESREKTYEAFSLLFLMAKAGEVQPLVRAIEGHPSSEVRLAVVKLLALSGQKEILPAFRRLAVRGSLPTEVRSAVMEAIYQISSSQPTHA
jgi:HEAT repeat protein